LKAIAIFYQGRKQDTSEVANRLIPFLQQQGHEVRVVDIRFEGEETPDPSLKGYDLAIVLGGDGTILHAARISLTRASRSWASTLGGWGF